MLCQTPGQVGFLSEQSAQDLRSRKQSKKALISMEAALLERQEDEDIRFLGSADCGSIQALGI